MLAHTNPPVQRAESVRTCTARRTADMSSPIRSDADLDSAQGDRFAERWR